MVGAGASQTSAATVSFDPPVVAVSSGETAEFLVSVTSTDFPSFDSVGMAFFYQDGMPVEWTRDSWVYDQSFYDSASPPPSPEPPFDCGLYGPCGLFVGGFNGNLWTVTEEVPLIIGTLSIDTTSLASGSHEILVDSSWQREFLGFSLSEITAPGGSEDISGRGTVIVPEPAMASLVLCQSSIDG